MSVYMFVWTIKFKCWCFSIAYALHGVPVLELCAKNVRYLTIACANTMIIHVYIHCTCTCILTTMTSNLYLDLVPLCSTLLTPLLYIVPPGAGYWPEWALFRVAQLQGDHSGRLAVSHSGHRGSCPRAKEVHTGPQLLQLSSTSMIYDIVTV